MMLQDYYYWSGYEAGRRGRRRPRPDDAKGWTLIDPFVGKPAVSGKSGGFMQQSDTGVLTDKPDASIASGFRQG